MTTMIAELYDALIAAGAPEDKARKAAETIAQATVTNPNSLATKADLAEAKNELLKWMLGAMAAQTGFLSAIKFFGH
ncbi:MAG: hypothetical protein WCF85_05970 [Rhodospirillaceae bacterium]